MISGALFYFILDYRKLDSWHCFPIISRFSQILLFYTVCDWLDTENEIKYTPCSCCYLFNVGFWQGFEKRCVDWTGKKGDLHWNRGNEENWLSVDGVFWGGGGFAVWVAFKSVECLYSFICILYWRQYGCLCTSVCMYI